MRILLIAPDQPGIDAIPEIRAITAAHQTHVLNGPVTTKDIYDAVASHEYDVIHFAGHVHGSYSDLDQLRLSGNETLDLDSATRLARLGKAKLVVFNVCLAARFATFMVRNGIPAVVYTTVEIGDVGAWELPAIFYEQCRRAEKMGAPLDFKAIFELVAPGDGRYAILFSSDYQMAVLQLALRPVWGALEDIKRTTESVAADVGVLSKRVDQLDRGVTGDRGEIPSWVFSLFILATALVVSASVVVLWAFLSGRL